MECSKISSQVTGAASVSAVGNASFLDWLVEQGRLEARMAERVGRVQAETADSLTNVLLKLGLLSEPDLASLLSEFCSLEPLLPDGFPVSRVEISGLNAEFLRAHEILPLRLSDGGLEVACWDPLDTFAADALGFAVERTVIRYIGTRREVREALESLYPREAAPVTEAIQGDRVVEDEEVDRLKDLASDAPIIRLVQRLINEAVSLKASDIHLEPSQQGLVVRMRLDGLLRVMETHAKDLAARIISRVKVMAGLDIAERRLPQDGRIRVTVDGKDIDFRVASSPTLHGESVVLRILDRQQVSLDFTALGFDPDLQQILREALRRPYGIVLVTGPTGSGKTTTLYAALKEINSPERKILTVEDPVEYALEGVNQVAIRPQIGLGFAQTLRSFLRQDPDVLMVGEIRDRETAEIAIQAALTGHLLLSTLHTNTAAGAVTRLLDMGIDDYLLASTLHVIVGQRLLRKLCLVCREAYSPGDELCSRLGVTPNASEVWYGARGCAQCRSTGFRGRTTILETLPMTDAVRSNILSRADAHRIEAVAVEEGMRTMLLHGIERIRNGVTTVEEVLRVTSLN
ncbi:MAG: GspE/PulE family protein [Steroidobacteraceae bacterium]